LDFGEVAWCISNAGFSSDGSHAASDFVDSLGSNPAA